MDPFEDGPPLEDEPDPPHRGRRRPKGAERVELPSPEAAALRLAWIQGVREYRYRTTGIEFSYNSNPQWDGGLLRLGSGKTRMIRNPVWPRIVETARTAGINDATTLVKTLFSTWTSDNGPTPWALVSQQNLQRAASIDRLRRRTISDALRTEEGVFRAAVWSANLVNPDPIRAAAHALNDVGRDMSPLFRYCAALLRGLTDVATRWQSAAVAQYRTDPASYVMYWAHLLPDELKPNAAAVGA